MLVQPGCGGPRLARAQGPWHRRGVKLFVSDLDGTLLDPTGRLRPACRDGLNELLDDGLAFTVASARSVHSIGPILDGLRLRLPVLEFNGAYLTELDSGRVHFCRSIDAAAVLDIVEHGQRAGLTAVISTYDGRTQRFYMPEVPPNAGVRWYLEDRKEAADARLQLVPDPAAALSEHLDGGQRVVCLTFIAQSAELRALQATIDTAWGARVRTLCVENRYSPGWHWLTVHDAHATKAHGLRELARHCEVELADITVFGDEINDLPMFEAAGRSVAVGNAVPDLRAIADELIDHHADGSVVRYLQSKHRTR